MWIVVPVGAAVFGALTGVRGALDPKSGILVLFRFWKEVSFPEQRVFAFGIHLEDDDVPFDVAALYYRKQMEAVLADGGVKILGMDPSRHGDAGTYPTVITLGSLKAPPPLYSTRRNSRGVFGPKEGAVR